MNLGNIFNKRDTKSVRAGESVRSADSVSKGERLMRLQNEVRSLKPGQTLQGTVVGRNGNSVQIELAQDFTINAKVDKSVSLALGQMMSFEIKANSSSFMSLAPLYTNTANTATILRALSAAGLPETAENMEMVAKMMEEGMSIDKESVLAMSRQLLEFPGQNPASIIQMTRLELPVTAENIEQFAHYANATHQILASVETIGDELPQVFQELLKEGQGDKAVAFYEAVLSAFSEADGAEDGTVTLQGSQTGTPQTDGAVDEAAADSRAAENAEIEGAAQSGEAQTGEAVTAGQTPLPESAQGKTAGMPEAALPGEETAQTGRENALTQGQWERLGDALRELGLHEQTVAQIKNGEMPPKEVLQLVRQFLQKAVQSGEKDPALQRFLGGREFQELLKQEIGRQWTIEPKDVADKKLVEQLYERIREQTARLSQALDTAGKGDAPVARSVQNLQNNVDFMNQMNHLYTYVQLPLKMLGNNAHGDLYVYTNKKNLAAKDGQVSALLHLDMEHLGPLDVYVTMKDKQVATNFTVMDDSILDLIENNIELLNKRLTDRGYSLKTQMHVKEDNPEEERESSIMQTLLHQQKNISVLSRTSFDMRA